MGDAIKVARACSGCILGDPGKVECSQFEANRILSLDLTESWLQGVACDEEAKHKRWGCNRIVGLKAACSKH